MITLKSLEDTQKLAKEIAKKLLTQRILCLFGNIGAGKTTFTKFLAEEFGLHSFKVKSPTYTYVRRYELEDSDFYHIDLYRIENFDELMIQELSEIIDNPKNIVVIEWADRIPEIIPKTRIELHFSYQADDSRFVDQIIY